MRKTRRNFLKKNVALAVTSLSISPTLLADNRFSEDPFGLGVASGSATHDSVVLWTRLFAAKALESSREMRISLRSIQNQRTPESQIETLAEFRLTAGSLKLDS